MNKTKIITIVSLIALVLVSAISVFTEDKDSEQNEMDAFVQEAENYMTRDLYQLAIKEYEKAIAIKNSEELQDHILDAYAKRYAESPDILEAYISAAEKAVSAYGDNSKYYIILAKAYLNSDQHQFAYRRLNEAVKKGHTDPDLEKLYLEVKYGFELDWYTYESFLPTTNNLYPVMNANLWGAIDLSGTNRLKMDYDFVSQSGDEGIRIISKEETSLVDENKIVRGKIDFVPVSAGLFSEELIAIQKGKSFSYYDSLGDLKFGNYKTASNFQNGKAAVQDKDSWYFIDSSGEKIDEKVYQEIKINNDGSYLQQDIVWLKFDGSYHLCDLDGNPINEFTCDDVDTVTSNGHTAFLKDGKWGFVNAEGEVEIEAKYSKSKSFSNGFAAVYKDGKWGFINQDGELVIDYQFFDADYFNSKMTCLVKTTEVDWQLLSFNVSFK